MTLFPSDILQNVVKEVLRVVLASLLAALGVSTLSDCDRSTVTVVEEVSR